jgi:hypothetical protein
MPFQPQKILTLYKSCPGALHEGIWSSAHMSHPQKKTVTTRKTQLFWKEEKSLAGVCNRANAVVLRVEIVSFPFDLHSASVFDSHVQCRARAIL